MTIRLSAAASDVGSRPHSDAILSAALWPPGARCGCPHPVCQDYSMNEEQTGSEDQPIVVDQTDKRSIVPFVAAAVIAIVVLIAIVAGGLLSPAEKNVTEADRLAAAVTNYIDARSRSEQRPPAGVACPGFGEEKSGLSERLGGPKSAVTIDKKGFDKATVNGDRAKIDATVQIGDTPSTSTWNLTRVDGTWLVCTP
ncbi:hypothetical protein ACIGO9_03070 [Nocardia asteroides]|uniref:Rv0361 family membrane protein n=1 Tax=Nocardia asteroides TaxID=1824 RepID=UPI0037CBDD52